ncbi:CBN-GEI-15 protein [Caenorhabditis brenneri]|uniref:CBN-GEI-15 protein n=1 Tax=Caenorhabditis brenneri TaxID=135651 RepID=G0MSH0_CAEBE|nr:CBN-GEI-15 protein [Caenorhabditis brenneri]
MSQYGSAANLSSFRERTGSPSYASLGKHTDNYNRFETARHAMNSRSNRSQTSQEKEEIRFGGFGDRAGSGVELSGFNWSGGEVITSPTQLPKAIKPRTMFYSPIGDGTVAADGYELKRRPVDLTPKVTVTQLQHIERGAKGHDGVNIIEKNWSTGGSVPASEAGFGSEYGPGSGRNSRAAFSPEPFPKPNGKPAPPPADFGNYQPKSGKFSSLKNKCCSKVFCSFLSFILKPSVFSPCFPSPYCPFQILIQLPLAQLAVLEEMEEIHMEDRNRTWDQRTDAIVSCVSISPEIVFFSVASSVFSDPSYRLDTKTGYLITNPRELIHQFATMTPVATIDDSVNNTPATHTIQKQSYYKRTEETTEEQFAPHAPYKANHPVASPNKFVRQLRDDNLTHSQREANTHTEPVYNRDPNYNQRFQEIRTKTTSYSRGGDDIDQLTQQLVSGMHTGKSRYN